MCIGSNLKTRILLDCAVILLNMVQFGCKICIPYLLLSIGTPDLRTTLVLKFELSILCNFLLMCLNIAVCMADSVDPDQMPCFVVSDLDPVLWCLIWIHVLWCLRFRSTLFAKTYDCPYT